ncbi:MAG: ATP-grasp domain-containing protein [Actinomycetota bacterium]|nr:ATP-grasp domain-containing protein [Actinomycetota bacterium]
MNAPSPPTPEPILLAAVSARMMAELAVDAGHRVVALDRFGDLDLQRLCSGVSLLRDLGGRGTLAALADAAESIDAPSVIYGAGFENRPDLVGSLAAGRRLLGNTPEGLRRVRDPAVLGACLRAEGLAYPTTLAAADAPRRAEPQRWLRKPLSGGAGRGVRAWRGEALERGVMLQERVAGMSCSVLAVADGRRAAVLGLTEQLIGSPVFGARGYAWCGNLVPPRLGAGERTGLLAQAGAVCACLAEAFGLRGLLGVDLVWDGERAWVVEVNPRPCGSLEVVEAAHGVGAFDAHLAAFDGRLMDPDVERLWARGPSAGKAVLFAGHDVAVGDTRRWLDRGIRDVPHPGERIRSGQPVCTLLSLGETPERVLADLARRAARLRAELHVAEEVAAGG